MKKIFFYDKKTGIYCGMTNSGGACPDWCNSSELAPTEYKKKGKSKKEKAGDGVAIANKTKMEYAQKIAAYSDRQICGAMIRAKGFKHELLTAEKASREQ